jgi:diguanylate cyclase (GGDEF)-like protein/PAS domain S-box-containing protein
MMHPTELSLRSLVAHAADLIAIVAPDGRFRYVSPAVESMLGYAPDAMTVTDLFTIAHPSDGARLRQKFTTSTPASRLDEAIRVRHRNGTWRWLSMTAVDRCADPALGGFVIQAHDVTEARWKQEAPRRSPRQGVLAGMPTADDILDHGARAIAAGEPVVIFVIGLDELDLVNDELGPAIADQVLEETAARLQRVIRPHDLLARDRDSRFILLLRKTSSLKDATSVAERLIDVAMMPLAAGEEALCVGVSVGMAATGTIATNATDLVRHASTAMRTAQRFGGARAVAYTTDMETVTQTRLRLHSDLRRALAENEFRLDYQPIIALRTGEVIGVEALLRWPGTGRLPADFMPEAEESGLIVPLGRWVIHEACRQIAEWERDGTVLNAHINLSVRQLDDTNIIGDVAAAVGSNGLAPDRLTLEITESVALDEGRHSAHLAELRTMGVRLAIDDFGTGYATPSSLRHGPFDEVKIDRSYTCDLEEEIPARRVLRAMLGLAGATGLRVVAEGVETRAQFEILREFGCDSAQGFYIARPVSAEAIPQLLEQRPWMSRWAPGAAPNNEIEDPGRLAALYRFGLLDTPTEAVFDEVTQLASVLLRVPTSLITFIDRDRQFFKSGHGLPEPFAPTRWAPLSLSICKHMVASKEPLVVPDARVDPLLAHNRVVIDFGIVGYAGVPITTPEGHTIGGFCALSPEERVWSAGDIAILKSLASLVMQIIDMRATADPYSN